MYFSSLYRRGVRSSQTKTCCLPSIFLSSSLLVRNSFLFFMNVICYRIVCYECVCVPESQCGFRRARSTTDMIFVARLLQEKCREQHRDLFIAFIDLTKAFDTVKRYLLWQVLGKFGCPPHFLNILRNSILI